MSCELETVKEAKQAIQEYMDFYNNQRPHQSLDYKVPREIHFKETLPVEIGDKSGDLPTVQQTQQQQHNLILTTENYISN